MSVPVSPQQPSLLNPGLPRATTFAAAARELLDRGNRSQLRLKQLIPAATNPERLSIAVGRIFSGYVLSDDSAYASASRFTAAIIRLYDATTALHELREIPQQIRFTRPGVRSRPTILMTNIRDSCPQLSHALALLAHRGQTSRSEVVAHLVATLNPHAFRGELRAPFPMDSAVAANRLAGDGERIARLYADGRDQTGLENVLRLTGEAVSAQLNVRSACQLPATFLDGLQSGPDSQMPVPAIVIAAQVAMQAPRLHAKWGDPKVGISILRDEVGVQNAHSIPDKDPLGTVILAAYNASVAKAAVRDWFGNNRDVKPKAPQRLSARRHAEQIMRDAAAVPAADRTAYMEAFSDRVGALSRTIFGDEHAAQGTELLRLAARAGDLDATLHELIAEYDHTDLLPAIIGPNRATIGSENSVALSSVSLFV